VIRLGARLSRRPERILYVSQRSARAHEALGYAAEKGMVIANGVDGRRFRPDPEAYASVRRELGLAPGAFLIGLFARHHPVKDHGTFLAAAERFLRSGRSAEFVLAGDDVTRSNRALASRLAQGGLGDRVHLLGPRTDMARLHAALDVLTCSSAFAESFPLVLAEAMASGVPCVTTDVGDAATIVGGTGRVIPPRDARALAGAWMDLVDLRPEHRAALGVQARASIVERFSIDETVRRYEAVYRELLAASVASP
jgi:glycosyltransferase involved in cell wall biosynthesis